jgi:DNA-directed RNA polymerase subunit M/transcription elongation factor TFIIS
MTTVDAALVNAYQASGRLHPMACPRDSAVLTADDTEDGVLLSCDICGATIRLSEKASDLVQRAMTLPGDRFVISEDPP